MKKDFMSTSIIKQKISSFDWTGTEIFKFLIAQVFMGHPVYEI